jgi:hypothetical protein
LSELLNVLKSTELVIGAVATHVAGTWEPGDGPRDAYLTVGGTRAALDVALIARSSSQTKPFEKARLREDRVALLVLRNIESDVQAHVPAAKTLIFTLGAPIKEPSKLVDALTKTLVTYFVSGAEEADEKKTILGNRVRFRVLDDGAKWSSKALGFVFSGDPLPGALANIARAFHAEIATKAKTRPPKAFSGERWLAVAIENPIADAKTYGRLFSLLPPQIGFARILMVFDTGRVEVLSALP